MKSGGRNSEVESTISSVLSSTLKSRESLSIIHNTTTRQTRFATAFWTCVPYTLFVHTNTLQDGRPVYIEKLGKIDLNALYKITTGDRMLQNLVVEYEKVADPRLPACSRKAGKLLETCCTIMDLKGVGISRVSSVYGYLRQASAISQDHYPERLGKLYLINAPWGFSGVWSVVKGFLDPVTVNKIHILGASYQSELLSQVPSENLPIEFGGTCACDGGCELSDMGPWQEKEWARPAKWESQSAGKQQAATQAPPPDKQEPAPSDESAKPTEQAGVVEQPGIAPA
jgi:hypothetical protein